MFLIIAVLFIYTSLESNDYVEIELANSTISNYQILAFENIQNKMYILNTQSGSGTKIDLLDLDKFDISKDIIGKYNNTFNTNYLVSNSKLFKDSKGNLWIGDRNQLLVLKPDGKIVDLYENQHINDSTYFDITSFAEDEKGNIFFSKCNKKIIFSQNGNEKHSWVNASFEIIKYSDSMLFKLLEVKNEFQNDNALFYNNSKLYFSFSLRNSIYEFDLSKNTINTFEIKTEFEKLDWENVKWIDIKDIIEINGKLFFWTTISADYSHFNAFISTEDNFTSFKLHALERDDEGGFIKSIASYEKYNNKIICSDLTYENHDKEFYILENNKFVNIDADNIKPVLITSENFKDEFLDKKLTLKENAAYFNFKFGLKLYKENKIIAGTSRGLLMIDNFFNINSIETEQIDIVSLPDLTKVKNELYIESKFNLNSYRIFDINSKTIQTQTNLNSNNITLNLEGLTIGIYFIEIETQKGSKLIKFIKN